MYLRSENKLLFPPVNPSNRVTSPVMASLRHRREHIWSATMRNDITGQKFGKLTAVRLVEVNEHYSTRWLFRCECGNEKVHFVHSARATSHCGCLSAQRFSDRSKTHGQSKAKTYKAWASMKYRCENPNNDAYSYYGGRGIKVCERWHDYKNFIEDMGERPDGMTIERKNVNGNYEPDNCIWASRKQQSRNLRVTARFTINGVCKALDDWCDEYGIKKQTVIGRIGRGQSLIEAFTKPIRTQNRNGRAK